MSAPGLSTWTEPRPSALEAPVDAAAEVRRGLAGARQRLVDQGIRVPELEGKLLRPLVAYALVPPERRDALDDGFWMGALAIQMVHEASLLHDDILDDAPVRRGTETCAEVNGVGPALVLGDLYLTGSYRAAASTGRPDFLDAFIVAVERTVAGEVAQGRSAGAQVAPEAYEAMVRGKSGALFGAAAVLSRPDSDPSAREALLEFGEALGATYQRVDDLLDYCSSFGTGKPPLQDYRQKKWTWVLDFVPGVDGFDLSEADVASRLLHGGDGGPASRALADLKGRTARLVSQAARLSPGDEILPELLREWLDLASRGLRAGSGTRIRRTSTPSHAEGSTPESEVRAAAQALGGAEDWAAYFGEHARTFHLAARLFPEDPARVVAGVYAFCRFTDDLVDDPPDNAGPDRVRARLHAWRHLTERALDGERTDIPVLDHVIRDSAARGVSPRYPLALLDGVAMDLERTSYEDWDSLAEYTFCVAGAVGGWLTQAFGHGDEALLECAHALGHAMQLTNIARDVGEDLARGRVYIPVRLLAAHELALEDLEMLAPPGAPIPRSYVHVMEALLSRADAYYAQAWPGIRALPGWYGRPVAAAAAAYRGIHDEIRKNGYDNLTRRAHTSRGRKLWLATTGLAQALRIPLRPVAKRKETKS